MVDILSLPPEIVENLVASLIILVGLLLLRAAADFVVRRTFVDTPKVFYFRRALSYLFALFVVLLIGRVWIQGIDTITTFLGLLSAGLAIALHDTIANIAGWLFIISKRPFKIGDRIEIGDIAGDVVNIGFLQFSLIEIGNWIDADQSTGRVIHVPNSKLLREPLANYHTGFEYIWNEIPVLVTFESNWRKAEKLFLELVENDAKYSPKVVKEQIHSASSQYLILYQNLTPIVYTTVKDSGVMLTIRHIVQPRQRRVTNVRMWRALLDIIEAHDDIALAYPTIRYYTEEKK